MSERPEPWSSPTRTALDQMAARWLIGLTLLLALLLVAGALAQEAVGVANSVSRWRFVSAALFGLASGLAALLLRAGRSRAANTLLLVSFMLGAALQAGATGIGLRSTLVSGAALSVGFAGLLVGRRLAAALALLDLGVIVGLYLVERQGLFRAADVQPTARLFGQLLLLVAGFATALLLARLYRDSIGRALAGERRFAELLNIGTDWVWEMDPKGRLTYISPSFEARTGRSIAEFMRRGEPGAPQVIDDDAYRGLVADMKARRPYYDREVTYRCADGTRVVIRGSGQPLFDAEGRLTGWWGASRNVTAQKLAERELQRSQAMADRLFESSPDAIVVADRRGGRILRANPAFLRMSGLAEAQLVGKSAVELGFWRRPELAQELGDALSAEGIVRNLRSEAWVGGERREVLLTAASFQSDGEPVAVITVRDITEVERAKQLAEEANRAKSAFLATMSHEIRTPLNGVLGLARLLQDSGLDERRRREYLVHLVDAAELLTGIVSDVLDLSKIEAGQLQIESIAFDLHGLVQSTFRTFSPLGRERGLAMHCSVAPDVPQRVRGDPVRVRQIIANYLNNALKFTHHGEIALAVRTAGAQRARFEVRDTGIGIGDEARALLFRPFAQADSSTTRRFGGTGLGLSICRELAERMGGAVGVDSDGRSGSLFWAEIVLPAEAASDSTAGGAAARPLAALQLLVAEDNPVNMLIVGALLKRLGANVLEAGDGVQAVELAFAHAGRLHAVLMDLHMPALDGLAATRRLRADVRTAALPVFAISAAVLDHERQDARDAGMNGFIAKPVSEGELLRLLQPLARDAASSGGAETLE